RGAGRAGGGAGGKASGARARREKGKGRALPGRPALLRARMRLTLAASARLFAGAFLLGAAALPARGAERLRLAAEKSDGRCAVGGKVLVFASSSEAPPPGSPTASCLFASRLPSLEDARIEQEVARLSALRSAGGVLLELPAPSDEARFSYAVKRLSSAFRGGSPGAPVALAAEGPLSKALEDEIDAYVDALADRDGSAPAPLQTVAARWALTMYRDSRGGPVSDLIRAVGREQAAGLALTVAAVIQSPAGPALD